MNDQIRRHFVMLFPFDELVSLHPTSKYRMARTSIVITGYLDPRGQAGVFRDKRDGCRIFEVDV